MRRRSFIKNSSLAAGLAAGGAAGIPVRAATPGLPGDRTGSRATGITPVLNAFSFNRPLLDGGMTLEDLFIFAAGTGFPGVD
ncbi:MAG: twin-arginine translocation signal domain-containing protein, partial [Bacteroidetes bacterium]